MNYKFSVPSKEENISMGGTSKICDIYSLSECKGGYFEKMALTFGQLKSAFGEPLYMTANLEEQYEYLILAEDEEGNKHYLSIYCGASGPSIGGKVNNKAACEAAQKLTEYIKNQEPIDYTYKCSYMDGQMEIEMGVKNGNPFCKKN